MAPVKRNSSSAIIQRLPYSIQTDVSEAAAISYECALKVDDTLTDGRVGPGDGGGSLTFVLEATMKTSNSIPSVLLRDIKNTHEHTGSS